MGNRSEIFMTTNSRPWASATTNTLEALFDIEQFYVRVIGLDYVYIVPVAVLLSPAVQWLLHCFKQKYCANAAQQHN